MAEKLDISRIWRDIEPEIVGEASFDLSGGDFLDYQVPEQVHMQWRAVNTGESVQLALCWQATIVGECARCLQPAQQVLEVEKVYSITPDCLEGDYPEYPTTPDGCLDLDELVYGEVVLEAPPVLVCSEDCPGLCGTCGKPQGACTCKAEPEGDVRWQALRDLLTDEDDK